MAVNWKQIMIMRLKGVSQDRVAGAARCSKRDVARASRVIRVLLQCLFDRFGSVFP